MNWFAPRGLRKMAAGFGCILFHSERNPTTNNTKNTNGLKLIWLRTGCFLTKTACFSAKPCSHPTGGSGVISRDLLFGSQRVLPCLGSGPAFRSISAPGTACEDAAPPRRGGCRSNRGWRGWSQPFRAVKEQ